jgi:uncharacterized protein (UPF0261 family)
VPEKWANHPKHAHNRLLTSIVLNDEERQLVARTHSRQLAKAKGPVAMILPEQGLGEWDRKGADLHNKAGLDGFLNELQSTLPPNVKQHRIDCHINDDKFAQRALEIFDAWCVEGLVA